MVIGCNNIWFFWWGIFYYIIDVNFKMEFIMTNLNNSNWTYYLVKLEKENKELKKRIEELEK